MRRFKITLLKSIAVRTLFLCQLVVCTLKCDIYFSNVNFVCKFNENILSNKFRKFSKNWVWTLVYGLAQKRKEKVGLTIILLGKDETEPSLSTVIKKNQKAHL